MRSLLFALIWIGCRDSASPPAPPPELPVHTTETPDARPRSVPHDDRPIELVEISKILTAGMGPTFDDVKHRNPSFAINYDWDGARVWLTRYRQQGVDVELDGMAIQPEDIAEFMKRLAVSRFFDDVSIQSTERVHDQPSGTDPFQFVIKMKSRHPSAAEILIKPPSHR